MAFVWEYVHKYVHVYTSQIRVLCTNSTKIVALLGEAEKIYLFRYGDSALHFEFQWEPFSLKPIGQWLKREVIQI